MVAVDVIFITYNQEQYVAQGIESIISQKVNKNVCVRVIVADDCSTDNTLNVIKSFENKSSFVFLYTDFGRNLGYHENYHRAFDMCDGNFIAILEGDDWWHSENHIQQHIDFLMSHDRAAMSFNRIRTYDASRERYVTPEWKFPGQFFKITIKHQIAYGDQIGNLSACVFRTGLVKKIPESFYELNFADWELGAFMAQFGYIAYLIDSTSTYRNEQKGQWTKLTKEEMMQSMIKSLDDMDVFFGFKYHGWVEQCKFNIENNIYRELYTSWKTKVKRFLGIV